MWLQESEQSGKEEDAGTADDNDWEPPSKRKRGPTHSRCVITIRPPMLLVKSSLNIE